MPRSRLVSGELWAEQRHAVLFEDGGDRGAIGSPVAGERPELFVELVAASWRVDNDDFARLVRQVQKRVRYARRQIGESALVAMKHLIADLDLEAPAEDVDRLLCA